MPSSPAGNFRSWEIKTPPFVLLCGARLYFWCSTSYPAVREPSWRLLLSIPCTARQHCWGHRMMDHQLERLFWASSCWMTRLHKTKSNALKPGTLLRFRGTEVCWMNSMILFICVLLFFLHIYIFLFFFFFLGDGHRCAPRFNVRSSVPIDRSGVSVRPKKKKTSKGQVNPEMGPRTPHVGETFFKYIEVYVSC